MKIHQHLEDSTFVVAVRGDINEFSEETLKQLLESLESDNICFEMSKVELINSLGARQWIQFMDSLRKRKTKISFVNCSVMYVDACNTYPKFAKAQEVSSFYIPYECSQCGLENLLIMNTTKLADMGAEPEHHCSHCKQLCKIAVDWEEYVQFLQE